MSVEMGQVQTNKQHAQYLQRQLIAMTAKFRQAHVNPEYEALCKQLIGKMARKRSEFSTEHMKENNPLVRLALVDGFLVIREL